MSAALRRTLIATAATAGIAVLSATTIAGPGVTASATTKAKATSKVATKAPGEEWVRALPATSKEATVIDFGAIRNITGSTLTTPDEKAFRVLRFITGGGYFTETWGTRGSKVPNGFNIATVDYEVTNRSINRNDRVTIATGIDTQELGSALNTAGFTKTTGTPFDRYTTTAYAPAPFADVRNVAVDTNRKIAIVGNSAPTSPAFDAITGKTKATRTMNDDKDVVEFLRRAAGSQMMIFFAPPTNGQPSPGFPKAALFGISTTFDTTALGRQQAILVYNSPADAKTSRAALAKAITTDEGVKNLLGRATLTVIDRTLVVDTPAAEKPALSTPIFIYAVPFPPLNRINR